jgi:hypothetical protein
MIVEMQHKWHRLQTLHREVEWKQNLFDHGGVSFRRGG